MTPPFSSNDEWSRCPVGYLQRYALVEKRQMWFRLAARATAAIVLLAVTASAAVFSYRAVAPASNGWHASPACARIIPIVDDFKAGKLDLQDAERVQEHLQQCSHCRHLADPQSVGAAGVSSGPGCMMHAAPPGPSVTEQPSANAEISSEKPKG